LKINSAEILCVGTEILIGDIVNTNGAYVSKKLAGMGIDQYYQAAVGDNRSRLAACINAALERCDLLILIGGLGPTYDDITKETAAECLGKKLCLHKPSLDRIAEFFREKNVEMPKTNVKQAYVPEGAFVFKNDCGTAPGIASVDETRGKMIIMLPGPPREMIPMFDNYVIPYLESFSEYVFYSKNINLMGIGESAIDAEIGDFMRECKNPTVAPYCGEGETRLRVTAKAKDRGSCIAMCDETIEKIRNMSVGKYIYGVDTNICETAVRLLRERSEKVSFAESCTGGLLMKNITDISGASEVFDGGVVSYAVSVKESMVGVDPEIIKMHGVVSGEVTEQMAQGAMKLMGADYGVGISGYAGPSGGDDKYPVGTVFFSICSRERTVTRKIYVSGKDRSHVRNIASNNVFMTLVNEFLK